MTDKQVFIKLGGSLITDKRLESSFRADVVKRIAAEIKEAQDTDADLRLLVAHGSGSFGHFAAARHGTLHGVYTSEDWQGFAEVAMTASRLNEMIAHSLSEAGLPVWRLQPSASARCIDGELVEMAVQPVRSALQHGLIPLLYGDVALDDLRGGTIISTERVLAFLAEHVPVHLIILAGEVPGVLDRDGQVIERISPANFEMLADALGGSSGTDVTGGMLTKVRDMLNLVTKVPELHIRIVDGLQPGVLRDALLQKRPVGTLLHA
ncbi:isopentenyl phosphate kinase family protein [bacterium]|nr:isopentenyl phosphate kinase family protein [bacterium]